MVISITGPELAKLSPELLSSLGSVLPRLAAGDSSLWGATAQPEAAIRLGWLNAPNKARDINLNALPRRSKTVLCGMGGSSLAPEVIAATYQRPLTVLDSTDPGQIKDALVDVKATTFVVASKSGSTIETDSQRRIVEAALVDAGCDPKDHIVVVTDPDSPLDQQSRAQGYYVINADPHVGGRFSALTAFGITPAYLIGADVEALVNDAIEATSQMLDNPSPAVLLAAAMIRHNAISPYITIATDERTPGFGDWVEQLVAESTGKDGKGILPIVVESLDAADFKGSDRLSIALAKTSTADLTINAPLGALFVLWEWATALAGYGLSIDPFNQPNVTESKNNTGALLSEWSGTMPTFTPTLVDQGIEIYTDMDVDGLADLFDQLRHHAGYIAVMAYLDRHHDQQIAGLRALLGKTKPCTFGWGPRFLHSTGQFHKGGPLIGAFLQITGAYDSDFDVPDKDYSFATLHMAQALGDYRALSSRDLSIVRLHLPDRKSGIRTLLEVAHAG